MRQNYLFKTFFLLCALLVGGTISAADTWVRTDPTELVTGDVVAIVDLTSSLAMSNDNGTSNAPAATSVTLSDDKGEISSDVADNLAWEVTVENGYYKFGVGENYLYCTNTNNGVRVGSNKNNMFSWIANPGDNNSTEPYLVNVATNRYLGVYNSQDWRCYTSINSNIKETVTAFFKKMSDPSDQSEATTVTIDATGITNTNVSEGTAAGKLTAAVMTVAGAPVEGAAITWTSDNEQVATIAADGTVTLVAAGKVIFTASYAGVEGQYKASRATYEMTVTNDDPNAPGKTQENPYTVAQAIENTPSDGEVYIKGIVSAFFKAGGIMDDSSNYRYYISDNGTTDNQLLVYKGKGLNNEAFAKDDDLLVGDEVIIYGQLITYKNAPEINSGNYIVSLSRQADERAETTMSIGSHENTGVAGETLTLPAASVMVLTSEVEGLNITWTSSDETVATIDVENKKINLLTAGETTITATFDGNEEYKACKASYVLTVTASEQPVTTDADVVFDFTSQDNWNIPTEGRNNMDEASFTDGTYTIKLSSTNNYKLNNGYLILGKKDSYLEFPAFGSDVEKIAIEGTSGASESVKQNIFVGEKAVSTETTGAKNVTNVYEIAEGYQTSGIIYRLVVTSSHNTQISKIFIYYKKGKPTAIQTVARTADTDGVAYNLAGQRVENPTKGLFIINGKKVILK